MNPLFIKYMSSNKFWTNDEEQVVISKVGSNPSNLKKAFKEASVELGRTPNAISMKWYRGGLSEKSAKVFITCGSKTVNVNRKIVSDRTSDNTVNIRKSKWRRIISILFGNE